MTDNLVNWLRSAGAPGMDEAADRIEKLEAVLRSIAANACRGTCLGAALVARKALEEKND